MTDLTTLGVTFHYAVETEKGTKPTTFTQLKRCSSIGGISLDTEQIDVSALEDYFTQYAAGRQDTGGSWEVTFNMNDDVITAIEKLFKDSKDAKAKRKDTKMKLKYKHPKLALFLKIILIIFIS